MTLSHDAELSAAFDRAALACDRLVAVNPGHHAHLRRSARRPRPPRGGAGPRLLDLGCGTGASTAALPAAAPHAGIVAVDASAGMVERAATKSWPGDVSFVHAPVERPAEAGVTGPFDRAFAAYLCRHPWRSVVEFDTASAFGDRLRRAGFGGVVRVLPMPGRQTGVAHTFVGRRAAESGDAR